MSDLTHHEAHQRPHGGPLAAPFLEFDPWESHESGIMNTLVPEPEIPSHQGPDAQTVDPDLDVVTMAVKVPETLAHLHYWSVQMIRQATKDEVLEAFKASSRIALIRNDEGLVALNSVKELMADRGRPHANLYEVALWAGMLRVQGDEVFSRTWWTTRRL